MLGSKSQRSAINGRRKSRVAAPPDLDPEEPPDPESGLSVGPDELGRQFLRDATHQDNFESSAAEWLDPREAALAQIESEGFEPGSDDDDSSSSTLVTETRAGGEIDPEKEAVDLRSSSIRGGSLFDQPTSRGETRVPEIHADESERTRGEARDRAEREELAALLRFRRRSPAAQKRRA